MGYEELKANVDPMHTSDLPRKDPVPTQAPAAIVIAPPPQAVQPQIQQPVYPVIVPGQPIEQFQVVNPPQMQMPRLAYPIIYQSAKPVATEPIVLDDAAVASRNVDPKSFCDKFTHSLSSPSNNFQVYDLVDVTDTVTFKCPRCQYEGPSRPMNTLGPCTYFGIGALCCICFPCGIAPCFIKRCQYIQHYCPQCGLRIGVTYPG